MLAAEAGSVRPDNIGPGFAMNTRLGNGEHIFRHGVGRLQGRPLQSAWRKRVIELIHAGSAHWLRAIDEGAS